MALSVPTVSAAAACERLHEIDLWPKEIQALRKAARCFAKRLTRSIAASAAKKTHTVMQKSLDRKLAAIHADPSGAKDFILADAKDADMAFGIGAPGRSPEMHAGEVRMRTLGRVSRQIRADRRGRAWSTSCSCRPAPTSVLTIHERLFDE